MIFAFEFQLTVDKLTKPAAEASKTVDKLTAAIVSLRKVAESVDAVLGKVGPRVGRAFDGERAANRARTGMAKIADEWQRMAAKAEAAEARATKAAEREAQKRLAIKEREARAGERMWTRIAFAAQRKQDKEVEAAAHKPWFGGHKSIRDLFVARAESKVSGMATGAADFALGLPGMAVGGIGGLALSGVKMAASAAIDLAKWSGEAALNFGQMAISAQALREPSVAGFSSIFGTAQVAEKLFDQAVRIAKLTKFDTPEVVQRFNDLAAGGFKSEELPMMFSAIADVQSARGDNYASRYSNAVQKLNAQPTALFTTFQQGAMAGPGLKLAEQVLAQRMGIKDKNIDAALRKAFREKKISGAEGINALLEATSQRYDQGGKLGTFARAQGEGTWEGLISNIRNGLQDVLTMKLPEGHPMLKFKGLLVEVNRLFDETTERGQRFQALMSKLVEDVFLVFDIDPSKTGQAMENLLGLAEQFEVKIRNVALWLRDNITRPFTEGLSGDLGASLAGKLKSGFIDLGITLGKAVAVGMFDALGLSSKARSLEAYLKKTTAPAETDQRQSTAQSTPGEAQSNIQWGNTGSWQIVGMGAEKTADSLGAPKMAHGATVTRPTLALIGERGTEHVIPDAKLLTMGGINIQQLVIQLPAGAASMSGREYGEEAALAFMRWIGTQGRNPSAATLR